jgi:asparagine synthase (glutamine-hydrolysing)
MYGIYRYDGAPVDPSWLVRMRSAMAYYGPDGGGSLVEGPLGMGHLLLNVNPEDAFEQQPLRGQRGLVVCTARLDNRDALLETFDVSASQAAHTSDGHLVSLAFDRWGQDVCSHLEGDWALAAWDAKERRLSLALNACGNETLYYFEGNGFVAFASSLKALLAIPDTVKEPDYLRLAEVLVSWQYDAELTAYKGFRRVLWAHKMDFGPDGKAHIRRYWSHEGREPLHYRRDEEYAEAFLEHYTRAVRSCLRTQKPVGAELSGGRDSGSVVALAAPILALQGRDLTAFTSVPLFSPDGADQSRLGDEWQLAEATAKMAGANVRHIRVDAKDYGVLDGIEYMIDVHDGPGHASCNHYWSQAISEAASGIGSRVLLSGQMGNLTISWSGNGFAVLALRQGHLETALRLFLSGESNPWLIFKRQVVKPLVTPCRRLLRRLRTPFRSPWQAYSALNVEMARQLKLDERMHGAGYDPTFTYSPFDDLRRLLLQPDAGIAAGYESEIGARHAFSIRDPTANLSMLEFLLRIPDDQFYRKGQSSCLYQRAFRNRVPEPVLRGRRKGLQASDLGHRILRELAAFRECLHSLESTPKAREILDLPLLHRCLKELVAKVDPETTDNAMTILVRGMNVGLFLRRWT